MASYTISSLSETGAIFEATNLSSDNVQRQMAVNINGNTVYGDATTGTPWVHVLGLSPGTTYSYTVWLYYYTGGQWNTGGIWDGSLTTPSSSGGGGGGSSGGGSGNTDPMYACYDVTTGNYINGWTQGYFNMTAPSYGSNYTYLGYCPGNSEQECLNYYTTNGTTWSQDSTYIVADCSYVIFFYRQNLSYAYITYYYNNGSGSYSNGVQNTFSNTSSPWYIYLDTPSRSGYNFLGWSTNNSSVNISSPLQVYNGSNYTLYAQWQRIYYYTYITYHYNGGSGSYNEGQQVSYSSTNSSRTITLDTPTKTNYTFLGWGTSSSSADVGTQLQVSSTNAVYKTLYAIWRRNTITVTYNTNGGSGGPGSQTVNTNSSFNINGSSYPTRNNYIFKGWSTSSTAKTATYKKGATPSISTGTSNITYYAVWWPAFTWKDYSRSEANTFAGYINTYLNSSIAIINDTNPLRLVVWFNAITTALGNNTKVASGDASFKTQLDALLTTYNNY